MLGTFFFQMTLGEEGDALMVNCSGHIITIMMPSVIYLGSRQSFFWSLSKDHNKCYWPSYQSWPPQLSLCQPLSRPFYSNISELLHVGLKQVQGLAILHGLLPHLNEEGCWLYSMLGTFCFQMTGEEGDALMVNCSGHIINIMMLFVSSLPAWLY